MRSGRIYINTFRDTSSPCLKDVAIKSAAKAVRAESGECENYRGEGSLGSYLRRREEES